MSSLAVAHGRNGCVVRNSRQPVSEVPHLGNRSRRAPVHSPAFLLAPNGKPKVYSVVLPVRRGCYQGIQMAVRGSWPRSSSLSIGITFSTWRRCQAGVQRATRCSAAQRRSPVKGCLCLGTTTVTSSPAIRSRCLAQPPARSASLAPRSRSPTRRRPKSTTTAPRTEDEHACQVPGYVASQDKPQV